MQILRKIMRALLITVSFLYLAGGPIAIAEESKTIPDCVVPPPTEQTKEVPKEEVAPKKKKRKQSAKISHIVKPEARQAAPIIPVNSEPKSIVVCEPSKKEPIQIHITTSPGPATQVASVTPSETKDVVTKKKRVKKTKPLPKTYDDKILLELDPFVSGRIQLGLDKNLGGPISLVAFGSLDTEKLLWKPSWFHNNDELRPRTLTYGLGLGAKFYVTRLILEDLFLLPHVYFGRVTQSIPESNQEKRDGWRTRVGLELGWERVFATNFALVFKGGVSRSFDTIDPFVKPRLEYKFNVGIGYAFR